MPFRPISHAFFAKFDATVRHASALALVHIPSSGLYSPFGTVNRANRWVGMRQAELPFHTSTSAIVFARRMRYSRNLATGHSMLPAIHGDVRPATYSPMRTVVRT